MHIEEAVATRRSIRAFRPDPVPPAILREVLEAARRTPSGGNLQPWHAIILTSDALADFCDEMLRSVEKGIGSEPPQYDIYPPALTAPYNTRRIKIAEDMYERLGIARSDRAARLAWVARNFAFFGAPVGMIVHMPATMGPPQWADLGMWMQTVMLLLRAKGLDSCAQEAWSLFHTSIRQHLPIPDSHIIFAGMAIGYADHTAPVNALVSERAELEQYIIMRGFPD